MTDHIAAAERLLAQAETIHAGIAEATEDHGGVDPRLHAAFFTEMNALTGRAQVHATLATRPAALDRAALLKVVDHEILHITGERDETGFKSYDHDDLAEAVTQAVMLALTGASAEATR